MKPKNIQLYNQVKMMADEIYKKPSAFKSGYIIKKYKELGGEFINDGEEKKLKRWFDEKWEDINPFKNDSTYPVFRPTVRINKETPLTVNEIDKNNLIEQSLIKQVIKGEKNLKPFKGKGINEMKLLKDISLHLKEHIKEGNYDDLDINQLNRVNKLMKQIKSGGGLIPANKIPKSDNVWEYSNPKEAQKKAFEYLGSDAVIYRSDKPDKKFMINDNGKWVHFGQMGYEDYLKHKNFERMKRYRSRATNMKGEWRTNPYSANNLSINVLW